MTARRSGAVIDSATLSPRSTVPRGTGDRDRRQQRAGERARRMPHRAPSIRRGGRREGGDRARERDERRAERETPARAGERGRREHGAHRRDALRHELGGAPPERAGLRRFRGGAKRAGTQAALTLDRARDGSRAPRRGAARAR